jgi:hypothetical protein
MAVAPTVAIRMIQIATTRPNGARRRKARDSWKPAFMRRQNNGSQVRKVKKMRAQRAGNRGRNEASSALKHRDLLNANCARDAPR